MNNSTIAIKSSNSGIKPESFVFLSNEQLVTTSLKIADAFKKLHRHVLKKIEKLECSKEFTETNFRLSEYKDSTGRKLPYYEVTKDGFVFLIMSFTGKKAAKIKEAYINAFNYMHDKLFGNKKITYETINPEQQHALQKKVKQIVSKLDKESQRGAYPQIWGHLKDKFKVPKYNLIPADKFDEAMTALDTFVFQGEVIEKKEEASTTVQVDKYNLESLIQLFFLMSERLKLLREAQEAMNKASSTINEALMMNNDVFRDGQFLAASLSKTIG